MKQLKLFQGTGISPASAKLITAYRIALVRDRPLSFGEPLLNNSQGAQAIIRTLIREWAKAIGSRWW